MKKKSKFVFLYPYLKCKWKAGDISTEAYNMIMAILIAEEEKD